MTGERRLTRGAERLRAEQAADPPGAERLLAEQAAALPRAERLGPERRPLAGEERLVPERRLLAGEERLLAEQAGALPRAERLGPERRLLPGAERILAEQMAELPQKDELCGAFQGLLALRAAAVAGSAGLDQDAVALAAGSVLSPPPRTGSLPPGERGRDDFRAVLPVAAPGGQVGTSACGLARAIEELAGGALAVVPASGSWSVGALATLLDGALSAPAPLAAIANLDVAALWDARLDRDRVQRYLDTGVDPGVDSPWRVGHFAALAGVRRGRAGTLVTLIDSYRSLGASGVHEQPVERVAAALRRRGVLVVVARDVAPAAREWVVRADLEPALWDNGSPDARTRGPSRP